MHAADTCSGERPDEGMLSHCARWTRYRGRLGCGCQKAIVRNLSSRLTKCLVTPLHMLAVKSRIKRTCDTPFRRSSIARDGIGPRQCLLSLHWEAGARTPALAVSGCQLMARSSHHLHLHLVHALHGLGLPPVPRESHPSAWASKVMTSSLITLAG